MFLCMSPDEIIMHHRDVREVHLSVVFNERAAEESFSGWKAVFRKVFQLEPRRSRLYERLLERTLRQGKEGGGGRRHTFIR